MAEKKDNGEKKSKGGEEGKKKDEKKSGPSTVVLKIDMHCEGCASKIIKCAKAFEGVEKAKVEWEASKLTVEGKVDPTKLRDSLQEKTKKKVELISPQPKKDKENRDDNATKSNKDSGKGQEKKKAYEEKKKADEEKKPKELPVTTAVLKLGLHCQGCVQKIHKFVTKTSGVKNVTIERQKDLVTVTGTMDAKALAEGLKRRMKREVEIIPQKKEKEKGKDNQEKKEGNDGGNSGSAGSEKKGGGGGGDGGGNGGGNGNGNGNGGKKKKGGAGGGGGGDGSNAGANKEGESGNAIMQVSQMEYPGIVGFPANTGYGYGYGYGGGYTYGENVHAPQYFSDENPNACSVM